MDIPAIDQAAEEDRLERAQEFQAERGEAWNVSFQPGALGCHELLDRTSLLANAIERQLLDHPACVNDPAWFALAHQAASALHDLYQRIGAEHLAAQETPE